MTVEQFKQLGEAAKYDSVRNLKKLAEHADLENNYQLFQPGDFYIEVRTNLENDSRKFFTYSLKNLPAIYATEIVSLPLVTLNKTTVATSRSLKAQPDVKKLFSPRF